MAPSHRSLWETGKSVLLFGLVALSVILTWLSWNYRPPFMAAEKQYTAMPPLGEEKDLRQIVIPEQLTFHLAGEHGLAWPFTPVYEQTLEQVFQWPLTDLTAVPWESVDWLALRRGTGIEMSYGVPIRMVDLPWLAEGDGGTEVSDDIRVHRAWMVEDDGVILYLLDDTGRHAYRGTLAADREAWNALLQEAASLPKAGFYPDPPATENAAAAAVTADHGRPASRAEGAEAGAAPGGETEAGQAVSADAGAARDREPTGWYLPVQAPKVDEEVRRWAPISLSSYTLYLFVDPTHIREIVTRDGVFVYTDGSRNLQVEPSRLRSIYDVPAVQPPAGAEKDDIDHVGTAIQFINQYGGWMGQYVLDSVRRFTPEHVHLLFRYYHGAYPVYPLMAGGEDARIEFSTPPAGQVMTLERPLYRFGEKLQTTTRVLPDGEAVYRRLLALAAEGRDIRQIRLAYQMEVTASEEDSYWFRLVPGWAFIGADGRLHWLMAEEPKAADDE